MRHAVPGLGAASPSSSCLLRVWDYVNCFSASMSHADMAHTQTCPPDKQKTPSHSYTDMTKYNQRTAVNVLCFPFSKQVKVYTFSSKSKAVQNLDDLAEMCICLLAACVFNACSDSLLGSLMQPLEQR